MGGALRSCEPQVQLATPFQCRLIPMKSPARKAEEAIWVKHSAPLVQPENVQPEIGIHRSRIWGFKGSRKDTVAILGGSTRKKTRPGARFQLASLFYHGQSHPLSGELKGHHPIPDFDNHDNPKKNVKKMTPVQGITKKAMLNRRLLSPSFVGRAS